MLLRNAKLTLQAFLDRAAYLSGPHRRTPKQPALWILMYHRILPKTDARYAAEEPGMVVEPDTFRMHLKILQQYFDVVPLGEWLTRQREGRKLPPKSCAITFDDGWLDNYQYAFPILRHYQVPATLFAVSHMLGTRETFWPNQIARLLKQPLEQLNELPWLQPHLQSLNGRCIDREAVASIIQKLKAFPDDQIQAWLQEIPPDEETQASLMSWTQLREMASSGLVDIGSHTCHHYRLNEGLDPAVVRRELEESKRKLEAELGQPVSLFCYPNGDLCDAALQRIPSLYQAAVTTQRGINSIDADPYRLLRIGIHQDRCNTPARFHSRLANWY